MGTGGFLHTDRGRKKGKNEALSLGDKLVKTKGGAPKKRKTCISIRKARPGGKGLPFT